MEEPDEQWLADMKWLDQKLAPKAEPHVQLKFKDQNRLDYMQDNSCRLFPIMMHNGVRGYISEEALKQTEQSQDMTQPAESPPEHSKDLNAHAWDVLDRLASCTMHLLLFKDG